MYFGDMDNEKPLIKRFIRFLFYSRFRRVPPLNTLTDVNGISGRPRSREIGNTTTTP